MIQTQVGKKLVRLVKSWECDLSQVLRLLVKLNLTSNTKNPSSWHLLAYFPEGASQEFSDWLLSLKEARVPRMKLMLAATRRNGS